MGAWASNNSTGSSDISGSGTPGQVAVFVSAQSVGNPSVPFSSSAAGFTIGSAVAEVSGILTLTSTTQGFIPPRLTTPQRTALPAVLVGMTIFNSTQDAINIYTAGAGVPAWQSLITSSTIPVGYSVGDLLYANTTSTLASLQDVAIGSVMASVAANLPPSWSSSPSIGTSVAAPVLYSPNIISSTTAATSISISSRTTGGVTIDIGGAGILTMGTSLFGKTITIGNSTALTSLSITGSTGGNSFTTNNGSFTISNGTGSLDLGTDAFAHTTTIGSVTGVSATSLRSGTGGMQIGTGAIDTTITIGNVTGASKVVFNSGSGDNIWTTTNGAWRLFTGTGSINIGTDEVSKTINIGTSTGGSAISFNAGTSGVNVGTNNVEHTITICNIISTSRVLINTGSAGSVWTTTNGAWVLNTGTATININADATINTINIGTGAAAKTINIGSTSACLIGFFSAAIARVTTGITAATFAANTSLIVNDTATFDGYTWGKVIKALRNYKILA